MRIDLAETGSKEIDIEFNGQIIDAVLWADEEAGECEVFEKHWLTGDMVLDPNTRWGYRSIVLKGKVTIHDRRPKSQSQGDTPYDFSYPYSCCLVVDPGLFLDTPHEITVQDFRDRQAVKTFSLPGGNVHNLVEAVLALNDRVRLTHVKVRKQGLGDLVREALVRVLKCAVFPT